MDPKHILVTGGAGFIGSNFVRWVLKHDAEVLITNLDVLTYAGNLESLIDVEQLWGKDGDGRYRFVMGDIRDFELVRGLVCANEGSGSIDAVVNFAAESHVDRSILNPSVFVNTNVSGTDSLLGACRLELEEHPREFRFIQVSTDEVYGDLGPDEPPFSEKSLLAPNNPYAASKAAADLLVRSYVSTYQLPAIVTRCSNNYGPYQFPEKLIPLMVTRALADLTLPVYGDGLSVRDWIHVEDHCEALWTVLARGELGSTYNIGGETEIRSLELVKRLLTILGKPEALIQFVADRQGHDRRYAMDITKIRTNLGWSPKHVIDDGLTETTEWYKDNSDWWERVLSEAYLATSKLYLTNGS